MLSGDIRREGDLWERQHCHFKDDAKRPSSPTAKREEEVRILARACCTVYPVRGNDFDFKLRE